MSMEMQDFKPKSFWQRPEGITGALFMGGVLLGGGYLLYKILPSLIILEFYLSCNCFSSYESRIWKMCEAESLASSMSGMKWLLLPIVTPAKKME